MLSSFGCNTAVEVLVVSVQSQAQRELANSGRIQSANTQPRFAALTR